VIYLEKNTANDVVLELSVLSPTSVTFLFGFVWENGNAPEVRYLTTPNISTALDRYDRFTFVESATGSTGAFYSGTGPTGMFLNPGQYTYTVWGSTTGITAGNVPTITANAPISSGRMVVAGTAGTGPTVYGSTFLAPNPVPNVYA